MWPYGDTRPQWVKHIFTTTRVHTLISPLFYCKCLNTNFGWISIWLFKRGILWSMSVLNRFQLHKSHWHNWEMKLKALCLIEFIVWLNSLYRRYYFLRPGTIYGDVWRPRQNDHLFADDISICIFLNESHCILLKVWSKFVHRRPINNMSPLV